MTRLIGTECDPPADLARIDRKIKRSLTVILDSYRYVAAFTVQASGIVKTFAVCSDAAMSQPSTRPTLYKGYRFPPEIISRCVWLYYRFGVSLRDVSELMLARGIEVSHEPIRLWTLRLGTEPDD